MENQNAPDAPLTEGPVSQAPVEAPGVMPKPAKPYDEMTAEEIVARIKFERNWKLRAAGVSEDVVAEWKVRFGKVASMEDGDDIYVYRPLSRHEKRQLVQKASQHGDDWRKEMDFAEETITACTLFPKIGIQDARTKMRDGTIESLLQAIQGLSGYNSVQTVVEL